MKGFLKTSITVVGFFLILVPFLESSQILGFQQTTNIDSETVDKDIDYLKALNERTGDLITAGEMDSVRILVDEALLLSRLFNDIEEEAKAYVNMGYYYFDRNLPDSVFYYISEPYERLKSTSNGLFLGNIIANAHSRTNNPTAALILQEELLARATEEENTYFIAGITQNMGLNYKNMGDLNSGIEHYLISLEMAEEMADSSLLAVILDNLGNMNTDLGNLDLAER